MDVAENRLLDPSVWGTLFVLSIPAGLLIWAILKPPRAAGAPCPACGKFVGKRAPACVQCGYAISPEYWKSHKTVGVGCFVMLLMAWLCVIAAVLVMMFG
jgi:hypothetical protein